jgi:hypothetical protein
MDVTIEFTKAELRALTTRLFNTDNLTADERSILNKLYRAANALKGRELSGRR